MAKVYIVRVGSECNGNYDVTEEIVLADPNEKLGTLTEDDEVIFEIPDSLAERYMELCIKLSSIEEEIKALEPQEEENE